MKRFGRKGGRASSASKRRTKPLADHELPALVDAAAAAEWCGTIALAAATGRISASSAQAALRAVESFLKAQEQADLIGRLETMYENLRAMNDGDPPARLLK